ncbi:hypothetical protein [Botrimarina sp.]|uniref:hypothetical protein n=1 Tax=Botrimarina sp. TaxID=2795802 RepID=UPI0032ED9596
MRSHSGAAFALIAAVAVSAGEPLDGREAIDRRELVERHTLRFDRYRPEAPASLGNGEFAVSFDVTGLQTLPTPAAGAQPLGTMAQWAWSRFPNTAGLRYEQTLTPYEAHGRQVTYADRQQSEAGEYFRANPHRIDLGRISLWRPAGAAIAADDLTDVSQTVSLWLGAAESRFTLDGVPVVVRTVVHPRVDAVAVRVESRLVAERRLGVAIRFGYPTGEWGPASVRYDRPESHTTRVSPAEDGWRVDRAIDDPTHRVRIATAAQPAGAADDPHLLRFIQPCAERLEATFLFERPGAAGPTDGPPPPRFGSARRAAAEHWRRFWQGGAAVDLSRSADPRWRELERRVVLSQFLTAVHCAGSMPPQETGLMGNSWFGKSHLEMHWWHAAHFAAWGRPALLERSLGWYDRTLPAARAIAQRQGYRGVRWPKMTGPDGLSSPSGVGEFLVWQQPHPIFFAAQVYRARPNNQTLHRFREVVRATAQFMADYASHDPENDCYALGPVLIPAQECYRPVDGQPVMNPTFELAQWRWALRVASEWMRRLGEEPPARWRAVAEGIAAPTVRDGVYTAIESPPYTRRIDHPSMLAALGVTPPVGLIDPATMGATLDDVRRNWDLESTWGWDCPMMAMTAARLVRPEAAIDCLLLDSPKNRFLANGHCRQSDRLPCYLPANGGVLAAVALMAYGWDGGPATPGFPPGWVVRREGLVGFPDELGPAQGPAQGPGHPVR